MKKKSIIIIVIASVILLLLLGVIIIPNIGAKTYKYNTDKIYHCDDLYITKTKYYKNKVKIYFNTGVDNQYVYMPDYSANVTYSSGRCVTIYSDNPESITSVNYSNRSRDVKFRYLDSEEYATIWSYWADDIGWQDYSGDKSKYYTDEEKRKQKEAEQKREEERKKVREESNKISVLIKGTWFSDAGDCFEICEDKDTNSYTVNYYMADEERNDWPYYINFQWIDEDNRVIAIYHNSSDFFDEPVYFEVTLSEDGKSFKYEGDDFYLVEKESNNKLNDEQLKQIRLLLNATDEWRFRDEEISENSIVSYKYALADLDDDRYIEVIKSGYTEEGYSYSVIYEIQIYESLEEVNSNLIKGRSFTQLPPDLLSFEGGMRYDFQDGYGYRYLVEGKEDKGENGYYKQYYLMSVVNNTVLLDKLCAEEDNGLAEITYYDGKGEEISDSDFTEKFEKLEDKKKHYVSLGWFEEINEENLEASLKIFLVSLQLMDE